jgi:transglutaminase-like putative cysteine protease
MLFEKITADERKLAGEECYLTVYRRVILFRSESNEWADVRVAYDPDADEIGPITGRTVLRDGRSIDLEASQIHDREVVRTEEESQREKFFTFPGIADTCIIEYRYRIRSENPNAVWIVQKNIPLLLWEYRWKFYDPPLTALDRLILNLYYSGVTPNYLWVNSAKTLDMKMFPDENDPEEVLFRVADIPGFDEEPWTLPDQALKTNIRLFYGSDMGVDVYWSIVSDQIGESLAKYLEDSDDLQPVVDSIAALPQGSDKVAAAFDWVRRNVRIVDASSASDKYEENESVNDVLDHRYGDGSDLNYVFHELVKKLGFKTFVAIAADRSRRLVYKLAKYWQFDEPVVGVFDSAKALRYHSPGDEETLPGQLPWYYEGAIGLVAGATPASPLFVDFPKSSFGQNTRARTVRLSFDAEGGTKAEVREILTGHRARRFRVLLKDLAPGEHARILEKEIGDNLAGEWKGAITGVACEIDGDTARVSFTAAGPDPSGDGSSAVAKPFSFLPDDADPFIAEKRRYPITFEFAGTDIDTLLLLPGDGWAVDGKPQTVYLNNRAGSVELRAEDAPEGLRIVSRSILRDPIYSENMYGQVKEVFSGRNNLRNIEIHLGTRTTGK